MKIDEIFNRISKWPTGAKFGILLLIMLGILVLLSSIFAPCAKAATTNVYCAVTAYDSAGNESTYSNEVNKQAGEGQEVTFNWDPPTKNEDGSAYTDPGGFKLYCGPSSGNYNQTWDYPDTTNTLNTATVKPNPTKRPNPPGNLR